MNKNQDQFADIEGVDNSWYYSEKVKDHFFNPRNLLLEDPDTNAFDTAGVVGSPACGDVIKVWLKVNFKNEKIIDCKWRTFGCASAIATASVLSEMVVKDGGMTLDEARQIKPQDIVSRLGELPLRKIHCSILGDEAVRAAINSYYCRRQKWHKIKASDSPKIMGINATEIDVEAAVARGAKNVADVKNELNLHKLPLAAEARIKKLLSVYIPQYRKENK